MGRKDIKRFNELTWHDVAFYCDKKGNTITVDELSNPSYIPKIIIMATSKRNIMYSFICDMETEEVSFKVHNFANSEKPFKKLKKQKNVYRASLEKINKAEIKVWSSKYAYSYNFISGNFYASIKVANL